jgi:hypothetical protein
VGRKELGGFSDAGWAAGPTNRTGRRCRIVCNFSAPFFCSSWRKSELAFCQEAARCSLAQRPILEDVVARSLLRSWYLLRFAVAPWPLAEHTAGINQITWIVLGTMELSPCRQSGFVIGSLICCFMHERAIHFGTGSEFRSGLLACCVQQHCSSELVAMLMLYRSDPVCCVSGSASIALAHDASLSGSCPASISSLITVPSKGFCVNAGCILLF